MTVIAGIVTAIALILTILVIVYSEGSTGYATVYASWIVTAVLWLAVAVG